jgi:hypothetical protein
MDIVKPRAPQCELETPHVSLELENVVRNA